MIGMTCTCKRCAYSWPSKTNRFPRQCPACKSYKWNKKRQRAARKFRDEDHDSISKMICTKCKKDIPENSAAYLLEEGFHRKGKFVSTADYGLYCEDCAPSVKEFPFV